MNKFVKIKRTNDKHMETLYKDLGVDYNERYELIGFGGEKIFIQVNNSIIDLYPSKVMVVE